MKAKVLVFSILLAVALLCVGISVHGDSGTAIGAMTSGMPLQSTGWAAVNNSINQNAWQTLISNITGGTPPYAYNIMLYNATGILVDNALYSNMPTTLYSFQFVQQTVWGAGRFTADITVTDSAYSPMTITNSLTYYALPENTTSTTSDTTITTLTSTSSTSISTTSTTTSTSTTIPLGVISVEKNGKASLKYQNGRNQGSVLVRGHRGGLVASRSVLSEVDINLTVNSLTINVSITNQSQVPASFAQPSRSVYQFIQINGTVANSTGADIDQFIASATYNFSVPAAWIQNHGVDSANIRLFKYDNASSTWDPLQTSFTGSDALDSFYSATSDSFSGYVISYIVSNAICATQLCTVTIGSSYSNTIDYFWAGAMKFTGGLSSNAAGNWVVSASNTVRSVWNGVIASGNNAISIGYNTVSNVGIFVTKNAVSTTNTVNSVLSGIGVNVMVANGKVFSKNSVGTSQALSFNTITSNSYVVLLFASGGAGMSTFSTNAPGSSLVVNSVANQNQAQSAIMVINSLDAGNGYNAIANTVTSASIGVVAYVFPTYAVQLKDAPAAGNIITSNMIADNIQFANGVTINVIGTQSINAIAPVSGLYPLFNKWTASNTANLIISSPTSQNTFITIEGNGILTATFNAYATVNVPSPSNAILDFGQYVRYNTIISNGIGPFTVNLINVGTGAVVNTITSANGIIIFGVNIPAQGTDIFNVIVVDTGVTPNYVFNSVQNTITVNPTLAVPSLTASNTPSIYTGGYELFSSSWSGGTVNYQANYIIFNSVTNTVLTSQLYAGLTGTSNTLLYFIPAAWAGNTITANVIIKDSASTPVSISSVRLAPITVNSMPTLDFSTPTSSANAVTITANNLALTNPSSGYSTYFWAAAFRTVGAANGATGSGNWITDNSSSVGSASTYYNVTSIGHNTVSSGKFTSASRMTTSNRIVMVSVGANVLINNQQSGSPYTKNVVNANSLGLIYTVTASNSFVVLAFSAASRPALTFSTNAPGNYIANAITNTLGPNSIQTAILVVNSLGVGTYRANIISTNTAVHGALGIVVYVFPPYAVNLLDTNPTTGTISVQGTQYSNGGTINATGGNAVTANPPSGYVFHDWIVSDATNIIIDNPNSQSANLTVEGPGTLTANYIVATCFTSITPSTINFGTIGPGTNVPTNYAVTDTDSGGTAAAYLYVFGGPWLVTSSQADGFDVSNTSWATSSGISYASATQLSASAQNTLLLVPSGGSNTVYFGLNIPPGAAATDYNSVITIENSC